MRLLITLLTAFMLFGCSASEEPHPVIARHVDAFNAGDLEVMSALQHPDIEWFGIDGADMRLEIAGREALAEMLDAYRSNNPTVVGMTRDWSQNGPYVSVIETASWTTEDGTKRAQSALSVYELQDGLIRRVWYFPSVSEPQ